MSITAETRIDKPKKNRPMIKVTLKPLVINSERSTEIASAKLINAVAKKAVEKLKLSLADQVCPDHPKGKQEIIVNAEKQNKLVFQKMNFCCVKFKDSIKLD